MKDSGFIFYCVNLLRCRCYKIVLNCGELYINLEINPIIDNKCFQYALTVALNYGKIGKKLEKSVKSSAFCKKT